MIRKLLYRVTDNLPMRYINHGVGPYMERAYLYTLPGLNLGPIQIPGLRFYIHRFVASDADGIHSHPFRYSFSCILAGWYFEDRWLVRRIKRFFNYIGPSDFHRVVLPDNGRDVWTLFIHTARVQPWGFLRKVGNGEAGFGKYEYTAESEPNDPAFSDWHLHEPKGRELRARLPQIPLGQSAPPGMVRATGREGNVHAGRNTM